MAEEEAEAEALAASLAAAPEASVAVLAASVVAEPVASAAAVRVDSRADRADITGADAITAEAITAVAVFTADLASASAILTIPTRMGPMDTVTAIRHTRAAITTQRDTGTHTRPAIAAVLTKTKVVVV